MLAPILTCFWKASDFARRVRLGNKKLTCAHTKEHREMMVDGRDKYHLALPPPRAITGAVSPSQVLLHKPRRNPEGPGQAGEPQYPVWRHNLYPSLPGAVPGDTPHQELSGHLTDWGESLPRGTGLIVAYRGRAFGDCTRLIMEYLGQEPTSGKGMDTGGLQRNRYAKIQE